MKISKLDGCFREELLSSLRSIVMDEVASSLVIGLVVFGNLFVRGM